MVEYLIYRDPNRRDTGYLWELSQARHTGHAVLGKYTQGEWEFTGRLTDMTKSWVKFWQAQIMNMQWSHFGNPWPCFGAPR